MFISRLLKLPVKELCKNKFKNLIWTSKFKCSFPGLLKLNRLRCCFELYIVFQFTGGKKGGNLVKYNTGDNNNVLSKAKKKNTCVSANML